MSTNGPPPIPRKRDPNSDFEFARDQLWHDEWKRICDECDDWKRARAERQLIEFGFVLAWLFILALIFCALSVHSQSRSLQTNGSQVHQQDTRAQDE